VAHELAGPRVEQHEGALDLAKDLGEVRHYDGVGADTIISGRNCTVSGHGEASAAGMVSGSATHRGRRLVRCFRRDSRTDEQEGAE
jgi:hypothetical protein